MAAIFISYRRGVTSGIAGRLFDHLKAGMPSAETFLDTGVLEPGDDFRQRIAAAIDQASLVIALVGSDWNPAHADDGASRFDAEDDFVRLELAEAIRQAKRIMVVTVDGAPEPSTYALPKDLEPLARIQVLDLGHRFFERDVEYLSRAVERHLPSGQVVKRGKVRIERPHQVIGSAVTYRVYVATDSGSEQIGEIANNESRVFGVPVGSIKLWFEDEQILRAVLRAASPLNPGMSTAGRSNTVHMRTSEDTVPVVRVRSTVLLQLRVEVIEA